ncbi:hypothetical protein MP638_000676 [Amoeboaphelidium occidentale]|nr:hypothetical protein MP638_000676 [Amoeboaphelidium occidentale]
MLRNKSSNMSLSSSIGSDTATRFPEDELQSLRRAEEYTPLSGDYENQRSRTNTDMSNEVRGYEKDDDSLIPKNKNVPVDEGPFGLFENKSKKKKLFGFKRKYAPAVRPQSSLSITSETELVNVEIEPKRKSTQVVQSAYKNAQKHLKNFKAGTKSFSVSLLAFLFGVSVISFYSIAILLYNLTLYWMNFWYVTFPMLIAVYFVTLLLISLSFLPTFVKKAQTCLTRKGSASTEEQVSASKWFKFQLLLVSSFSGLASLAAGISLPYALHTGEPAIYLTIYVFFVAGIFGFLHGISFALFFAVLCVKAPIEALTSDDKRDLMYTQEHNFARIITDELKKCFFKSFVYGYILVPGLVNAMVVYAVTAVVARTMSHNSHELESEDMKMSNLLQLVELEGVYSSISVGSIQLLIPLLFSFRHLLSYLKRNSNAEYSTDLEMRPVVEGETESSPILEDVQTKISVKKLGCFSSVTYFIRGFLSLHTLVVGSCLFVVFMLLHAFSWFLPVLCADLINLDVFSGVFVSGIVYLLGSAATYCLVVRFILPRRNLAQKDIDPSSDRNSFRLMAFLSLNSLCAVFACFFGAYFIPLGGNIIITSLGLIFAAAFGIYPLVPSFLSSVFAEETLLAAEKWSIRNPVDFTEALPDLRRPASVQQYELKEYRRSLSMAVYVSNKFLRLLSSVIASFGVAGIYVAYLFALSKRLTEKITSIHNVRLSLNSGYNDIVSLFEFPYFIQPTQYSDGDYSMAYILLIFLCICLIFSLPFMKRVMARKKRNEILKIDKEMKART